MDKIKTTWDSYISKWERIRIIGPMNEQNDIVEYLYANKYQIIKSGPYSNKNMFPKVDSTKFLVIAERKI